MSERRSLDRLLLPRMRTEPEGVKLLVPESSAPLPRWQTLPLDAKFPVIPAAKDEMTFVTTKICQPAYRSTQHETFDLSDPYNRTIQTEYQALRDPYLKDFLAKPHIRKQLLEQNLLTPSGKVPCTVRDFNNYRNFLRRQALIKNKEPDTLTRATENRNLIMRKTKMKAELVSVEVKCKSLKAQQMLKEAEEEKQRQFWRKQALEIEREQKRAEEEKKAHDELLKKRRERWIEKQREIREKEEIARMEHDQKVLQIELEAQEKLNKVDAMRQYKQQMMEARRRQQWHQKCQYQIQVLEEAMMQQKRVEIEMEMRRRQYEDKMTSSSVKYQDAAGDTLGLDEILKSSHDDGFITGQGKSHTAHHKYEPEMNLSRRASMWILEELLYSSGMFEEVNVLVSTSCPQEYSRVLHELIGSVMSTTRSSSVLGVEQDALSKIIHLIVRQLEEAYLRKEEQQRNQETAAGARLEAGCLKRLFMGLDVSLETERARHVCMSATLDMDCKFAIDKSASDNSQGHLSEHEERARLFSNYLRLPESEIREMEAELSQLLLHFQKATRTPHEQKKVLEMFLKLACHDASGECDAEENNHKPTLKTVISCPSPVCNGRLPGEFKMLGLQTDSQTSVGNRFDKFESGGEDDTKMIERELKDKEDKGGGGTRDGGGGGDNNVPLGVMAETEMSHGCFKKDPVIKSTEEVRANYEPLIDRSKNDVDEVESGSERIDSNETVQSKNSQRQDINHSPSDRDVDGQDHLLNPHSLDISKSITDFGCNNLTGNTEKHVNVDKTPEEPTHPMHTMNESVSLEVGDSTREHQHVEPAAELVNPEENFCSADHALLALNHQTIKPMDATRDHEQCSGMPLSGEVARGNELGNVGNNHLNESNCKRQISPDECSGAINTEPSFSITIPPTIRRHVDQVPKNTERAAQEVPFTESGEQGDFGSMAARFLVKMEQKELQGIGYPPAKIHYIITTFLSRLWRSDPGETVNFGSWLYSPDVPITIRSLIYNVNTMRWPQELINVLTNAIVTVILHNQVDFRVCLPEGVIRTTIHGFTRQLEKEQVSVRILTDVLFRLQEEYDGYLKSCQSFQVDLFVIESLSIAEDLLLKGEATSNDFVKNILDYPQLPRQSQVALIYSPWKTMLHQTKVAVQLSAVAAKDRTQLEYLVLACGGKLINVAFDNVKQCIEQLRLGMEDEVFRVRSAVTLSASVVAALLHTVQEKRISGLTLLPGALTLRSLLSPDALGQDNTGEAVVLMILDGLARDMGEDTLDRQCLGHIAASLVDLLTREFSYQSEALEGEGLAGGLDCMTSRFRCKSLEFTDSCKIMSAILRPYLGFLLQEDGDPCFKVDLEQPVCVDEDLLPSLFDFITEVFVTFVRGMIARMRRHWVGNDLDDDLLVLYVWRTMAKLAKEANKSLCHKNTSNTGLQPSFQFARWNLGIFMGLVDTFKGPHDKQILGRTNEGNSQPHTPGESCPQDRTETVPDFLACLSRRLPEPGYVPVPDLCISNQAAFNDAAAMRGDAIPAGVEKAARREIIGACQLIFQSVVTAEALQEIKNKLADHVTCAVFVIHRLTTILSEKIWTLKEKLGNNSLTVNDMIPFLVNCQVHNHQEALISKEFAFKILTLFILELEAIQQAAAVLSDLVQRLARIDQHSTGAEGNFSSILSAISSAALTQFIRAFIVDTLKMVAWLIDKIYRETGIASMKTPLRVYTSDVTKIAIAVVSDGVKFLKQVTRKEAKVDDGRGPRHAAGASQDLLLQMPKEVKDNVIGCIVDIIENIESTDTDTEMETPSASDMVAFLISQILTSVTSLAGAGKCYCMCVNDLLLSDVPNKPCKQVEVTDAGGRNAATLEKREMHHLLTNLEQKESEYLLQRLTEITSIICNNIKQEINDAVLVNEPCDSLLQAFAFMNVKLGKVQHDLSKRCITLANRKFNVAFSNDVRKQKDAHSGAGASETIKNTFSNEAWKVEDGKMPVSEYIENLLRNVTDVKTTNKGLNIYPSRVIKVILKACYSLDVSYLAPESAAMHSNDFIAQSVVLVEVMINELYNKLAELQKARTKEIDKETNYPYLFSRAYTTPDPWGPYYSDVAVRARQLTDSVRAGSVTRSHVQRLSAVSSLMSSKDESFISESSQAAEELCSTAGEDGVFAADDERQSRGRRRQTRAAAWRRKVQDCSSVHNKENTLRMWVRNDIEMSHKMSGLQKKSKPTSTGKQVGADTLTVANKVEKLEKVGAKDSQNINGQSKQEECHKRLGSAQPVGQKSTKSVTPVVKTAPKKVTTGKNDKSQQQITGINEKNKDTSKDTKDGSSRTRVKIREAATQKHVSRISGRSRVKSTSKSTEVGASNAWPMTVHIIHHAYTEKSNTTESQIDGTSKADLEGQDTSLNQLAEEQPTESQTTSPFHELKEEEVSIAQQQSASTDMLLSLLGKDLPRHVMAVRRSLGKEAMETVDLANVLCAVDLALGELEQGDELQAVCVLEGGCAQGKVSQRTVDAINNQLRSLTNNNVSDEEIQTKLNDKGTDCQNADIFSFRKQLITSLSEMADRAGQGYQVPEVFSGRQAEVLDALRYVRETPQDTEGVNQQGIPEENVYESDGGSSAAESHSRGCKTSTNSLTPSCNTALTSVSVSDADGNDDKCIISSSWTILTSCPSLSSSRSSNIDHARHAEGDAVNKQSKQKPFRSAKAEGISDPGKETQPAVKDSKTGITCNIEDGVQPSGRGSVSCTDNGQKSRHENEYNDNGQCSEGSSIANVSMTSQERRLPDKAAEAEAVVEDHDDWSVSGHSSKTGSGHSYASDVHHLDDLPVAERPYSQNEKRPASDLSSWSSSPKSSRCSSARSSRDEGASSPARSLSSTSTTSVRPGKQNDGRASSRSSGSRVSVDQEEATQLEVADDDKTVRCSGARDRDGSSDLKFGGGKDDQQLSQSRHNHAGTATTEAPAQDDLSSDGYSTDHESCASEEVEDDGDREDGDQHGRKMVSSGVADLVGGGGVSRDDVSDVGGHSKM